MFWHLASAEGRFAWIFQCRPLQRRYFFSVTLFDLGLDVWRNTEAWGVQAHTATDRAMRKYGFTPHVWVLIKRHR